MRRRITTLLGAAGLVGACGTATGVPDLNNVSAETLQGALTTASAQLLVSGLLNQYRNSAKGQYIMLPEAMARDAFLFDGTMQELIGNVQPTSTGTGGFVFNEFFIGIRSANTLIDAATAATDASGMTTAQRQSLIGLGQTMKALNAWNVIETRDTVGMPIDLDHDINASPAPWTCKQNVLAYISVLLDSAATALGAASAASAAFPVTLPSGYRAVAGTPAGFLKLNRGLKAKIELYRGLGPQGGTGAVGYNAAVAALTQSFLQTTDLSATGLALGVYETYSIAAGETTNALVNSAWHLNPAVADSLTPGDLRGAKIVKAALPRTSTILGFTISTQYDYAFSLGSAGLTHALPILKNEELLLLRAQAAIELNDLTTATTYLNYVRVNSGGLAPYAVFATQTAARNALLYEKRYSLLFEGPQRLLDLRAYGRLNAASFTPGSASSPLPGDVFTSALLIPLPVLNARGGSAPQVCP